MNSHVAYCVWRRSFTNRCHDSAEVFAIAVSYFLQLSQVRLASIFSSAAFSSHRSFATFRIKPGCCALPKTSDAGRGGLTDFRHSSVAVWEMNLRKSCCNWILHITLIIRVTVLFFRYGCCHTWFVRLCTMRHLIFRFFREPPSVFFPVPFVSGIQRSTCSSCLSDTQRIP